VLLGVQFGLGVDAVGAGVVLVGGSSRAGLVRLGQDEGEGGSAPVRRPQLGAAAVVRGDVLDDAEAEARPAGLARPGEVAPVEALEDALLRVRRDALTLVDDGDADETVLEPAGE
jgi:hypothetical protein